MTEQVVDQLESATEAAAIFSHCLGGAFIAAGGKGAGLGCSLEQRGCLGFDDGHVFGYRQVGLGQGGELTHFALGDDAGGARQDIENAHVACLDHQGECAGEQEVANQDRSRRAPDVFGGRLAAAQIAIVDHIVVEQGRGVDEFDCRGEAGDRHAALAANRAGRSQRQEGAQALAAGGNQIARKIRNCGDGAGGALGQELLDLLQVRAQQRREAIHRNGRPDVSWLDFSLGSQIEPLGADAKQLHAAAYSYDIWRVRPWSRNRNPIPCAPRVTMSLS